MLCFVFALACLPFIHAVTVETVMVDMSHTYDERIKSYLTWKSFNKTVIMNGTDLGIWILLEEIQMPTHMGTHIDAPSHVGHGGIDVDQIPLSSLIAPAAVIDIVDRAASQEEAVATVQDFRDWESRAGRSLNGTIVLLRTGRGAKWDNISEYTGTTERDYTKFRCPAFGAEAARWLVGQRSVKGIGTDALSFDRCSDRNYPVHQIFHGAGLYGLENVANVDKIPIYGAMLYVLPMKIGGGSGAPARIVATYPKVIF